jgi:hypothetical protein
MEEKIAKLIRYHSQNRFNENSKHIKAYHKNTESIDRSFTSQGKLETKQIS